ncbi:hypothetical protein KZX70_02240 [Paenibacillus silvae]|uniref:hypothetical protein n=1 Tax=Paenibacillus silvae TaxID=1325358 RepID=UPI002006967B|nr:hypothetical protein [Paenibacillus silvae]MCK6073657.1 hypothetical protein [Paenibacillus silvae]MCK6148867.1 hypothetical protein [Paenibacillus silvae]
MSLVTLEGGSVTEEGRPAFFFGVKRMYQFAAHRGQTSVIMMRMDTRVRILL